MSGVASMDGSELARLVDAVQRNCDRADALHAREKSLCTYLLGMREYFRWAERLPLGVAPEKARLGRWIARREQMWDELREQRDAAFEPLPLDAAVDPFDETGANRRLTAHGLVYGAGVGLFGAPLFFLAERQSQQMRDGARVIVADRELARGVAAPPAMSRGQTVIVRLDALRRWLWTRAELAQRDGAGAFGLALRAYADSPDPARTVERMARGEVETLVLHELGELRAGELLGPEWERMLAALDDRAAEVALRAVRDVLADCLVTLPALIERRSAAALHTWFALLDGPRRALAPQLAALHAADFDHGGLRRLADEAAGQAVRSRGIADHLLSRWRAGGAEPVRAAARTLLAAQVPS